RSTPPARRRAVRSGPMDLATARSERSGQDVREGRSRRSRPRRLTTRRPARRRGYIAATMRDEATFTVKAGLAEMLKGGVIMDVVTPEQARIAEAAGACAVMALERVPADIRRDGGVA